MGIYVHSALLLSLFWCRDGFCCIPPPFLESPLSYCCCCLPVCPSPVSVDYGWCWEMYISPCQGLVSFTQRIHYKENWFWVFVMLFSCCQHNLCALWVCEEHSGVPKTILPILLWISSLHLLSRSLSQHTQFTFKWLMGSFETLTCHKLSPSSSSLALTLWTSTNCCRCCDELGSSCASQLACKPSWLTKKKLENENIKKYESWKRKANLLSKIYSIFQSKWLWNFNLMLNKKNYVLSLVRLSLVLPPRFFYATQGKKRTARTTARKKWFNFCVCFHSVRVGTAAISP